MENTKIVKVRKTDDPAYFKNYYHTSGLSNRICCPRCKRNTTNQKILRHQKSKLCKISESNEMINLLSESSIIN